MLGPAYGLLLNSIFIPTAAHLPLSLCCLIFELDLPILGVGVCAVMHSKDDWAGQQGSGRPTAHHRGQECLSVFNGWPRRAENSISDISIAFMCMHSEIFYLKLNNIFWGAFFFMGETGVKAEPNWKTCSLYWDFDLARLEVFMITVGLPASLWSPSFRYRSAFGDFLWNSCTDNFRMEWEETVLRRLHNHAFWQHLPLASQSFKYFCVLGT